MSKKPGKKSAPKKPAKAEKDQLTDEQLDNAAGGGQPPPGDMPVGSPKLPSTFNHNVRVRRVQR
jgi:hypothetical protein